MRAGAGAALLTVLVAVLLAGLFGACDGNDFTPPPPPLPLPDIDPPKIELPALPRLDLEALPLPRAPDGNLILIEVNNSRLEIDPTASDAITAVGTCTDLISYCFAPPSRSLEQCVAATPSCATQEPWTEAVPCCPSACRAQFQSSVDGGRDPLEAFQDVFFREPDCFPGVRAALEGR